MNLINVLYKCTYLITYNIITKISIVNIINVEIGSQEIDIFGTYIYVMRDQFI